MDDIYPHFQVTATACPAASYGKLAKNTGYLDYDYVERTVAKGGIIAVPVPVPVPIPVVPVPSVPIPTQTPAPDPVVAPTPTPVADTEVKEWYNSNGVRGGIITVCAAIAGIFGLNVDAGTQGQIANYAIVIMTAFGGLLAIYGRVKASKTIK